MSDEEREGLSPARLIARSWGQTPESGENCSKSDLSAAVWSQDLTTPREISNAGLPSFHILTLKLRPFRVVTWHDGRQLDAGSAIGDDLSLALAGMTHRAVIYENWRLLHLYIPDDFLIEVASEANQPLHGLEPLALRHFRDSCLKQFGRMIAADISRGDPCCRIQLEALGTLMCIRLLRRGALELLPSRAARPELARWQLRRAIAYIADHMTENVTLAALAADLGISRYHFARGFKHSTGMSPHRYLLMCRLERAEQLLAATGATVAEISAIVGYDEPGQLSRLFRKELGVTPSAYRRSVRS